MVRDPNVSASAILAFLSACHSEVFSDALIHSGVDHVVGININKKILDIAARRFAAYIYRGLFGGMRVKEAFLNAQASLNTDHELKSIGVGIDGVSYRWREGLKFFLLPHQSAQHLNPLHLEVVPGAIDPPVWSSTNVAARSASPFVGRREELHQINMSLLEAHCVSVHGIGGMGKTALALGAARWQHERGRWADGVWLIECRNIDTVEQLQDRLAAILELPQSISLASLCTEYLARKHILVLLDDLDSIIESHPRELAACVNLLLGCRRLSLITTSRRDLPGDVASRPLPLPQQPWVQNNHN
jgi:hypothetical protein